MDTRQHSDVTQSAPAAGGNALHWLALALTPGLGPTRTRKLAQHFGGIENVFRASLTELEAAGLPAHSAQSIATGKSLEMAQEELIRATTAGAQVITLDDAAFPPLLRQIYDPPVALYIRGNVELLTRPGIAVVGTRHPTPYGIGMAERLAADLASRGLVITSGMARGVDSYAHRGALMAKGKTIAIFGTGIDVINALEQGRELFAVPGNVTNKNSWGPNTLIKQGAKLTATWEDVWEELAPPVKAQLAAEFGAAEEQPATGSLFGDSASLSPREKKVYALLKADEAVHIDELIVKLEREVSSPEIFAILFELELSGKIKQLPGKNFVRTF